MCGVDTFVLETGFSESGKNVTELAKQQKRKVVFKVGLSFPYQTSRLEVTSTSEVNPRLVLLKRNMMMIVIVVL